MWPIPCLLQICSGRNIGLHRIGRFYTRGRIIHLDELEQAFVIRWVIRLTRGEKFLKMIFTFFLVFFAEFCDDLYLQCTVAFVWRANHSAKNGLISVYSL